MSGTISLSMVCCERRLSSAEPVWKFTVTGRVTTGAAVSAATSVASSSRSVSVNSNCGRCASARESGAASMSARMYLSSTEFCGVITGLFGFANAPASR